jgi:hypothetical protein
MNSVLELNSHASACSLCCLARAHICVLLKCHTCFHLCTHVSTGTHQNSGISFGYQAQITHCWVASLFAQSTRSSTGSPLPGGQPISTKHGITRCQMASSYAPNTGLPLQDCQLICTIYGITHCRVASSYAQSVANAPPKECPVTCTRHGSSLVPASVIASSSMKIWGLMES